MKTLVAGWFSFPGMGATAGDLLTRDVVCEWLETAGCPYDVALAAPFTGGVDWQTVDPGAYSDVVFVCGPLGNGWPIPGFLDRFDRRPLIGVNLSMLDPIDVWNPFDLLLERDSSRTTRPDVTLLARGDRVPVVGVVLVHRQKEYRDGAHETANAAIERLVGSRSMAAVPIDTRLDINATGLATSAEVESLIARMDVVVTTRLHGMVLAIKNGVPALAIDPIPGGAKVVRQAAALGWPQCFPVDAIDDERLARAFEYCLTSDARSAARACADGARTRLADVRERFLHAMASIARVD